MNKLFVLFLVVAQLFSFSAAGQNHESFMISSLGDTIVISPIPVVEVSASKEKITIKLIELEKASQKSPEIERLDTILVKAKTLLVKEKERLIFEETDISIRILDDLNTQWSEYDDILKSWQATISNRLFQLEEMIFELQVIVKTWEQTKTEAQKSQAPPATINGISEVIANAAEKIKEIKARIDEILVIQSQVTDFQIEVNKVLDQLLALRKKIQSSIFVKDSPALWSKADSAVQKVGFRDDIKQSYKENLRQIENYVNTNEDRFYLHGFIFLIYLLIFYFLNRFYKKNNPQIKDKPERIRHILTNLFPSALLLALISSLFIYSSIPTAVNEILKLLLIIPALWLIPGIVSPKLKPLLVILVIVFALDLMLGFFSTRTIYFRLMLLATTIISFWLVNQFGNKNNTFYELANPTLKKSIRIFMPVYFFLLCVALIVNILGFVNLANIIMKGLINSIMIGVLLFLMVVVINVMFRVFLETPFTQYSFIVANHKKLLLRRIHSLLVYLSVYLWIRSILVSVGILQQAINWLVGLLDAKWEVKNITISVGGIFGFFMVIFFTWILVKIFRYLLEEEIFPRIRMARGVPGAISMIIRYTIVAFGIYIAISAAGIDLERFGLIAGALGVGIGFGLQGVVYNFIAGLILAFERPIQKGDTIEVGTLMGDVKNIGVRSSTIRTYDGSEVIVPNGNLISNEVINWTLSDRKRRRIVPVNVAYGTNPREVMKLMAEVAGKHPDVLPHPKPWPLFDGFGESALKFRILFWVDFDSGLTVQSEVAMMLYDALQEKGIKIPYQQQDIYIKNAEQATCNLSPHNPDKQV